MSKIMHAGRSLLELVLLIVLGLVPVVSGLLVMVYQLETKLAENANISVQEAVFSVDQALDRMREAAHQALPFAGKRCNDVVGKLQDQVAGRSMVHSLSLIKGDQAYCSTTSHSLADLSAFALSGRQVELAYGSKAASNKLLVNFYLRDEGNGVIVTAYAMQLRNELDAFQDGLTLLLEFGDRYIWSHGDSRDRQPPSQTEFTANALSAKYGYQVKGGYAQGYTAGEARQSMLRILPSLVLVGVGTGSIVYLTLFRARINRRGTAANPA